MRWQSARALCLAVWSMLLCSASGSQPAATPTVDDIRTAVAARNTVFDQAEMVVGVIRFDRRIDQAIDAAVWLPSEVQSAWYRRQGAEVWSQIATCSVARRRKAPPISSSHYFVHETPESREAAAIHITTIHDEQEIQYQSYVDAPAQQEAWISALIGWQTKDVSLVSLCLDQEDQTIARATEGGYDCLAVGTQRATLWVAPALGYAPVRCDRYSEAPDGCARLSSTRWVGYHASEVEGLWVPSGRVHCSFSKPPGADEDEFVADFVGVYHVLSCKLRDLPVVPAGAGAVPVLVGGYYRNRVTGLPEQPTTFGYSLEQLRRIAFHELAPFGFEIPELLALPRATEIGVPARQPGDPAPQTHGLAAPEAQP